MNTILFYRVWYMLTRKNVPLPMQYLSIQHFPYREKSRELSWRKNWMKRDLRTNFYHSKSADMFKWEQERNCTMLKCIKLYLTSSEREQKKNVLLLLHKNSLAFNKYCFCCLLYVIATHYLNRTLKKKFKDHLLMSSRIKDTQNMYKVE